VGKLTLCYFGRDVLTRAWQDRPWAKVEQFIFIIYELWQANSR